ncbi:hypothetical protein F4804DRAFT_26097 [Jackrogersella minutella]|nr:hypothetical protein F4804DRAFT_26097 [Jackrogersella minutella]
MPRSLKKSFVERSRIERQAELARLAQERHTDLGLVFGLSSHVYDSEAHFDYVGGLNTDKLWTGLAKLLKPARWDGKLDNTKATADEETLPSLRDALLDAAPVGLYQDAAERKRNKRKDRDFAGILGQIDTNTIAVFALEILQERRKALNKRRPAPLQLPTVRGPSFGSAHVFYTIEFRDAVSRESTKWIIKIPVNGTPDVWDRLCPAALRSEALVLDMLALKTTVPVPEIIDADAGPHNDLHVPYLIMKYVEGRTLDQVWLAAEGEDEGALRERRSKILHSLARAMVQLGEFEFEQGGAPVFDGRGRLVSVGPMRELDVQGMIDRWFGNEDCERAPLYTEVGPFTDVAEMYTALLDSYPSDMEANTGVDTLLRLLIRFIREPPKSIPPRKRLGSEVRENDGRMKFVLTHSDLKMRNVVVSEEGNVKGILGWDAVRIAPKSVGNEALPSWLVRDFNPFVWRWRPAPEFWRRGGYEDGGRGDSREDAPWVLRELRGEYAAVIRDLKERGIGVFTDAPIVVDEDWDVVDVTKQSLLALSLDTAVRDPRCRSAILRRILEKCSRTTEEFDFDGIVEVLGRGGYLDGYKLKCLERNFRELVERGYVRGAVVW